MTRDHHIVKKTTKRLRTGSKQKQSKRSRSKEPMPIPGHITHMEKRSDKKRRIEAERETHHINLKVQHVNDLISDNQFIINKNLSDHKGILRKARRAKKDKKISESSEYYLKAAVLANSIEMAEIKLSVYREYIGNLNKRTNPDADRTDPANIAIMTFQRMSLTQLDAKMAKEIEKRVLKSNEINIFNLPKIYDPTIEEYDPTTGLSTSYIPDKPIPKTGRLKRFRRSKGTISAPDLTLA